MLGINLKGWQAQIAPYLLAFSSHWTANRKSYFTPVYPIIHPIMRHPSE